MAERQQINLSYTCPSSDFESLNSYATNSGQHITTITKALLHERILLLETGNGWALGDRKILGLAGILCLLSEQELDCVANFLRDTFPDKVQTREMFVPQAVNW